MKHFLLLVLVINSLITHAQLTPKSLHSDKGVIGFYEFRPTGYKADSSYNYPLMIFLHGIGERGNGTTELPMALNSSFAKILKKGASMKFVVNGVQHAFLVLIPQMSKDYENWQNFYVDAMIGYAKKNLKIDTNKIFVTGWSLGGGGAWKYATASVENASKLAGIIPVAPAPDYTDLCNLARGKVAVWAHHARDDASVPLHYTEDAITAINACSPTIPAIITYYPVGGHPYVADRAYDTVNEIGYPNVFQWMIGTSRSNNSSNNLPPVANAGNDTSIILSSTSAVLNGSASHDPNDVIVNYKWSVVSGPPSPAIRIGKEDFPIASVAGLEAGDYVFRLTVKDEFGIVKSDDVSINVILPSDGKNALPVVEAGAEITTTASACFVRGAARDFDGIIKTYQWRQVSGPSTLTVVGMAETATIIGLEEEGTYGVELSVSDNHNPAGMAKDTLLITRNPSNPIYYNSYSPRPPAKRGTGLIRYDILSVLLMLSMLPALIFNCFAIGKWTTKRFCDILIIRAFCYFQTFFILLRPLTQFLCI